MRVDNIQVFDEYPTADVAFMNTSDAFDAALGAFDQLALMAVVDDVTNGSTGFAVKIWHSADGRNWLPKNGSPTSAEIGGSSGLTLPASWGQTAYVGGDAGGNPSLGLVRLSVTIGATGAAHVRVWVTGRNRGGAERR